tara:strand:- start:45 stop:248 length:204 start_codon:yes stop_codon:yes gene_type:complete
MDDDIKTFNINQKDFNNYKNEFNTIKMKVIIESFKYLELQLDKDERNYLKTRNKYEKIKNNMLINKM